MDKLQGFKLYLIRQGKDTGTIITRMACLKVLLSVSSYLEKEVLEQELLKRFEKGNAPSTLNNLITALRQYGDYIGKDYRSIKYFKLRETQKSTMSDQEIEEFINLSRLPSHDPNLHKVFNLFFKILAYSGMRPGEVASLTVESLDFGRQVFILPKTKTTPRLVPIAQTLLSDLKSYIKTLPDEKLFNVNNAKWNHHFEERIKRLGIKRKGLSTYSLRHSFITRMLDEDVNLFKVQKIVGHERLETTAHYTHLTTKDITRAITKDPLSRSSLDFNDRFKLFRDLVRKGLEDYALSREEEKEMLAGLY